MLCQEYFRYSDAGVPCALVCETIGYADDWQLMETFKRAKVFLSLCICIILLKVIKFLSALVPKMDLAPIVLKKALPDLIFFMVVFLICVLAFSSMFYIQLGPVMVDFNDQLQSFLSLSRALFGDFAIDEVLDNDTGYLNAVLVGQPRISIH